MQQSARDLGAPTMAAVQVTCFLASAVAHIEPVESCVNTFVAVTSRQAMQRREITQILTNGQIEVQCRLLEDDPESRQCGARLERQIDSGNLNGSSLRKQQTSQQAEQSRFSRPIRPQKGAELPRPYFETDAIKRLLFSVAVFETLNTQTAHWMVISIRWVSPVVPGILM